MIVFAIDPSIKRLGWALMSPGRLIDCGLITSADMKHTSWEADAIAVANRVKAKINKFATRHDTRPTNIISETPQEFGSARGAASLNSGSVRKLAFQVGYLAGLLSYWSEEAPWATFTPNQWKGSLPKEVTRLRVEKAYPKAVGLDHNIIDAIGIGHFWLRERRKQINRQQS